MPPQTDHIDTIKLDGEGFEGNILWYRYARYPSFREDYERNMRVRAVFKLFSKFWFYTCTSLGYRPVQVLYLWEYSTVQ